MHVYRTVSEDVEWAQNGVVATVINGEAIPVVQHRIADAGFIYLDIIPMGADKVFVRSLSESYVTTVVDGAKEFFTLVFSKWERWDKEAAPFRRGAWLLTSGQYMIEKVRLDYARVMIATDAMEVIKGAKKLLVDGAMVEVKIMEEWGYA
ncbi:sulfate transporter, partial [Trifolium medium]|nr:sulfate transporter [Trifolium medium]